MTRRATLADAAAIAEVQLRVYGRDYADILPPDAIAETTLEERVEHWTTVLATADMAGVQAFVFDGPGVGFGVVGFAIVGPMREPAPEDGVGEIHTLYVEPLAQNSGVGTALAEEAEQALRAAGHTTAVLWSYAANGRAERFYTHRGWVVEPGSSKLVPDHWLAPAVRLRKAL